MLVWWSLFVAVGVLGGVTPSPTPRLNDRPIIGILAQNLNALLAEAIYSPPKPSESPLHAPSTPEDHPKSEADLQVLQTFEYLTLDKVQKPDIAPDFELDVTEEPARVAKESSSTVEAEVEVETRAASEEEPPKQYIAASYVKFLEAAGARVVPILSDQSDEYYEHMINSVNGVLFPGGAVPLDTTTGFGRAGKIIYERALQLNAQGDPFPLWGACLGFELMVWLAAECREIRVHCEAQNSADHLKLADDYAEGQLLRHMPKSLLKALITKPITANFHHFCVTPKNFTDFGVDKVFRPLAFSSDRRGVEYVAAAEARDYPFFAVQFHPEKAPYEWTTVPGHNNIPHTRDAVRLSSFMAEVFINYARRSHHAFANATEEMTSLIYNFPPIYTGSKSAFEQMYIF